MGLGVDFWEIPRLRYKKKLPEVNDPVPSELQELGVLDHAGF